MQYKVKGWNKRSSLQQKKYIYSVRERGTDKILPGSYWYLYVGQDYRAQYWERSAGGKKKAIMQSLFSSYGVKYYNLDAERWQKGLL